MSRGAFSSGVVAFPAVANHGLAEHKFHLSHGRCRGLKPEGTQQTTKHFTTNKNICTGDDGYNTRKVLFVNFIKASLR